MIDNIQENKLKENEKKFQQLSILSAPGPISIGLGFYIQTASKETLHSILSYENLDIILFSVGGTIMFIEVCFAIKFFIEKRRIKNDSI